MTKKYPGNNLNNYIHLETDIVTGDITNILIINNETVCLLQSATNSITSCNLEDVIKFYHKAYGEGVKVTVVDCATQNEFVAGASEFLFNCPYIYYGSNVEAEAFLSKGIHIQGSEIETIIYNVGDVLTMEDEPEIAIKMVEYEINTRHKNILDASIREAFKKCLNTSSYMRMLHIYSVLREKNFYPVMLKMRILLDEGKDKINPEGYYPSEVFECLTEPLHLVTTTVDESDKTKCIHGLALNAGGADDKVIELTQGDNSPAHFQRTFSFIMVGGFVDYEKKSGCCCAAKQPVN